jgi:hypothetical protein
MNFHRNPSAGSSTDPFGKTNGRTDKTTLIVAFRNCLANAPKINTPILIYLHVYSTQQEDSFHQQIGLKFSEETSKVLH